MADDGWGRRRSASWVARALILGGLLIVVVFLPTDSPLGIGLPLTIEVVTVAVVVVSAARKSVASRTVWWCIAVTVALGVAGDLVYAWQQYRLFTIYGWCAATCTAAMGSKWQPEHIGLGGTERSTIAAVDLDCLGLLTERLA